MAREQTHAAHPQKTKSGAEQKSTAGQQGRTGTQGGKAPSSEQRHGTTSHGRTGGQNPAVHLQKFLGGVNYPCNKEQLIERARADKADREVLTLLEKLPEREYDSATTLSREVAKLEKRGTA